jgi:hypothetical protein
MKQSRVLPVLRMLPTPKLIPHEDADPRRVEKLSRRIREEGLLKNPPIVAEIPGSDGYVVLDGANRVMAFKWLKIPHMVVQVVNYEDPDLILDTWYHVVSGLDRKDFEAEILAVDDLRLLESTLAEARRALDNNKAIAYIVYKDGVRIIECPEDDQRSHEILVEIVNAYKGRADIFRASNDNWEIQEPYYPQITALVVFPRYHPKDILHCAQNGYKVPSGITRHIIPARALNINIPLDILESNLSLDEKRQWLHDWLMERMASNAIRYYAESTFSFNE